MTRRTTKWYATRVVALATILVSTWGVGTSAADTASVEAPSRPAAVETPARPAAPAAPAQAAEQTTTIRYGPYGINPAAPGPNGMRRSELSNQFAFGVQKPCNNCYITSMQPRLVKADGTTAGRSNNLMLHHMVLFNTDANRTDATCEVGLPFPLGLLFGQRFFASGDERTLIEFPDGYGYRAGTGSWNLIWDLMSMSDVRETVYYEMTYTWVPGTTAGMRDIEPIWFDIAQCGFSTFSVPAGPSTRTWSWTVNRPGVFTQIGGHGHDGTTNITIRNDSTGEAICDSRAGYGDTPLHVDPMGGEHLSSMTTCGGGPDYDPAGSPITNGQRVTITANYDMDEGVDDQMGIVMGFVGEASDGGGGPGGEEQCFTATNSAHVTAGRATSWLVFAFAEGSNAYIGLTSHTTSLQEGPTGTWTAVTSC